MERLPDSPKEVNLWRVRILPIYPREKLLAVNRSPEQSEWSGLVRKDCSRFAKSVAHATVFPANRNPSQSGDVA